MFFFLYIHANLWYNKRVYGEKGIYTLLTLHCIPLYIIVLIGYDNNWLIQITYNRIHDHSEDRGGTSNLLDIWLYISYRVRSSTVFSEVPQMIAETRREPQRYDPSSYIGVYIWKSWQWYNKPLVYHVSIMIQKFFSESLYYFFFSPEFFSSITLSEGDVRNLSIYSSITFR